MRESPDSITPESGSKAQSQRSVFSSCRQRVIPVESMISVVWLEDAQKLAYEALERDPGRIVFVTCGAMGSTFIVRVLFTHQLTAFSPPDSKIHEMIAIEEDEKG